MQRSSLCIFFESLLPHSEKSRRRIIALAIERKSHELFICKWGSRMRVYGEIGVSVIWKVEWRGRVRVRFQVDARGPRLRRGYHHVDRLDYERLQSLIRLYLPNHQSICIHNCKLLKAETKQRPPCATRAFSEADDQTDHEKTVPDQQTNSQPNEHSVCTTQINNSDQRYKSSRETVAFDSLTKTIIKCQLMIVMKTIKEKLGPKPIFSFRV